MYLVQRWYDKRINTNFINEQIAVSQTSAIAQLWNPQLYFVNGMSSSVANGLEPLQKVTIDATGLVSMYTKLVASFDCYMNLLNYPMDFQYCKIVVESCKFL